MDVLKDQLTEKGWLSPDIEEILQRVILSVNRFKNTVAHLTEISRLQKDFNEEAPEVVSNVKEIYEDIMADLDYPTKQKACFIKTDF
ncbi:hypothetical protein [Rufibacter radiotolerans]|uniref:hypothetical protein n=1 Tax=Rufibacter radiotolerans TaxID=1379910 RepID=UPI0009E5693B|nr:hypothetical protein [Rufibacter radiotolerans]